MNVNQVAKRGSPASVGFPPSVARGLLAGLAGLLLALPAVCGSVSYTYDSLGRLKTSTFSNGVVITYTYDAAGNRSSQVTSGVP